MTREEQEIIKNFAAGRKELKDSCIEIYRKYLNKGEQSSIEMKFMSEIDNICPDLNLRAHYRNQLFASKD